MIRDFLRNYRQCPDDGVLRRALDEPPHAGTSVGDHLASCDRCARRMEALCRSADEAGEYLARIEPEQSPVPTATAMRRLEARAASISESQLRIGEGDRMTGFLQRRGARAVGVILALFVVTALVTVSPMGSVASDFLDRFRVQRFKAITIDMESFQGFQTDMMLRLAGSDTETLQSSVQDLATVETSYGDLGMMGGPEGFMEPGSDHEKPDLMENIQEFDSAEDAEAAFGDFKQPEDLPDGFSTDPAIYMGEAGSATVTVDTEEAQAIIDELNLPIYSLPDPEAYPEMTFTMDIPQSLVFHYENADDQLMVGQMTSPVLQTPESVNMDDLREDVLQMPGLPTDFVAQLRSIENWEETLVIPVPEGWSSEDVTVQGQPGLMITADDEDRSFIVWEDDGMLYAVGGTQTGDALLDVANSMS